MSHIKFRRELVMALVGNFRQGGATTRGRTSTSDNQQTLNGMLHVIISHPEKKHKDCIVCSKRIMPGGRRKQRTFVKHVIVKQVFTWERVSYHTLKNFKL
jgi:hypothetical protein